MVNYRLISMKKVLLGLLYTIGGILAFALLYLSAEFILSRIKTHKLNDKNESPIPIYLLSNGVHTDLVFLVKTEQIDWHQVFPVEHTIAKDSTKKWVAIGWGDKGFYLNTPEWKDLSLKTALVAGLGIGETALHVTYYGGLKEDDHCYQVHIGEEQYQQLIDFVLASLELDEQGKSIYIETNMQYGKNDAFYEALGAYHLFYSCNTWTNSALKRAKLPSAVWTVFDKGILRHYKSK